MWADAAANAETTASSLAAATENAPPVQGGLATGGRGSNGWEAGRTGGAHGERRTRERKQTSFYDPQKIAADAAATGSAEAGRKKARDYRAFFFEGSEILYTTMCENYEQLSMRTAHVKKRVAELMLDDDEQVSIYLQKIYRHLGPKDKATICNIVSGWEAHHSLTQVQVEVCVRILNTMHNNHCDYLDFSAAVKRARPQSTALPTGHEGNTTETPRKCLPSRPPIEINTFRMDREWMGLDPDPSVTDERSNIDLSVMMAPKDWNWTQEIETFF